MEEVEEEEEEEEGGLDLKHDVNPNSHFLFFGGVKEIAHRVKNKIKILG